MDKYSNITKIKLLAAKEREAIHRWHELSSNAEVKNIEYSQNGFVSSIECYTSCKK